MRISMRVIILLCAAALMAPILSACDNNGGGGTKLYPYDPGDSFVTNFTDEDTKKMLKSAVAFEITDGKAAETLAERNFVIRDAIIKELSTLSLADATANKDLDALCVRLVTAVNEALRTDIFMYAYFNEFTVANA